VPREQERAPHTGVPMSIGRWRSAFIADCNVPAATAARAETAHFLLSLLVAKKIEAIIVPSRLAAVMKSLTRYGVEGLAVSDVTGSGREKGWIPRYRGSQHAMGPVPKIKLEVAVCDEWAAPITQAIMQAARTGRIGDGKVFVTPLDEVVGIGTDEEAPDGEAQTDSMPSAVTPRSEGPPAPSRCGPTSRDPRSVRPRPI
jgi:nitrogen regulatory protein P-II 1